MSAPSRPAWTRYRGYPSAADASMRVSDAERNEVADELSRHYGDGRLDETEFNQRLDQAMQATPLPGGTTAPARPPPAPAAAPPRRRPRSGRPGRTACPVAAAGSARSS